MARFGAGCRASAAPKGVRNEPERARVRGRVPKGQHRDAQPRQAAWQYRDQDRGRRVHRHFAIRLGYCALYLRRDVRSWHLADIVHPRLMSAFDTEADCDLLSTVVK